MTHGTGWKQGSEAAAGMPTGGGDFIRHLRLYDDQESAVIRFLSDVDDVFWGNFHRVMKRSQKGVTYYEPVFCLEELHQSCPYCQEDISMSYMFLAWVYEYRQFMALAGEGRERITWNGLVRFKEEIGEARLMHYSHMHKGSIDMRVQRYGNLTDRDYEWIRTGVKGTNRPTYILEPVEGTIVALPPDLEKLRGTLPKLEDIALGRVRSLDGQTGGKTRESAPRRTVQVPQSEAAPPPNDSEAESEGDDWLSNPFNDPPKY
jgi:hypothetical protein